MMLTSAAAATRPVNRKYSAPPDHCRITNGRLKKNASWCTPCSISLSAPWASGSMAEPRKRRSQKFSVSSTSQVPTRMAVSTAASQGFRSTRK